MPKAPVSQLKAVIAVGGHDGEMSHADWLRPGRKKAKGGGGVNLRFPHLFKEMTECRSPATHTLTHMHMCVHSRRHRDTHSHTGTHVLTYTHTHTDAHTITHTYTYAQACMHTYTHRDTHRHSCTYIHTLTINTHAHILTHADT